MLQEDIEGRGGLERVAEVHGNDHVHDVDALNVDTVLVEALVEVVHEGRGELALDVTDLANLDHADIVANRLLALLLQELLKLVRAQVIEELLAVLLPGLIRAYVEGHADIHRDLHVVFCGASLNLNIIHILRLTGVLN